MFHYVNQFISKNTSMPRVDPWTDTNNASKICHFTNLELLSFLKPNNKIVCHISSISSKNNKRATVMIEQIEAVTIKLCIHILTQFEATYE